MIAFKMNGAAPAGPDVRLGAVLVLALAGTRGNGAGQRDRIDHGQPAGLERGGQHRHEERAGQAADRLLDHQPDPHRARLRRHRQRHRQEFAGHQPGRPARDQRGAGRRTHAPGVQPQARAELRHRDRRQVRDRHGRRLRRRRPGGQQRRHAGRCRAAAGRPPDCCATWISSAAPTAKAASWSTCRTARSRSTCARSATPCWSTS